MRTLLLVGLVALAACDDHLFPPPANHGGGTTSATEGWCAVQSLFQNNCLSCHSAASALGGLDLETDPHAALVGVTSVAFGAVLVEPGDAQGSLLYRKMAGTQGGAEGGLMPPTGALAADPLETVRAWIDDGASDVCAGGGTGGTGGTGTSARYHPEGWAAQEVHGLATKLQTETDCRTCHGEDLQGGSTGIACGSCHPAGWETTCTFCHGGTDNPTGAPPRDIDGNLDIARSPFQPHSAHVTANANHVALACTECHVVPTDALTPGHLFDDPTAGQAEVVFGGLSPQGQWDGLTCSNLYCHGYRGEHNGVMDHTAPTPSCSGCHPDRTSGPNAWGNRMSGEHERHLDDGVSCHECHGASVDASMAILDPARHVDGIRDVQLAAGMTRTGNSCAGVCHGQRHDNERW